MKNEEYQRSFDAIKVPKNQLEAAFITKSKSPKYRYGLLFAPVLTFCLLLVGLSLNNNGGIKDDNYFFTTIYAEDKSVSLASEEALEVTMNTNLYLDNQGIATKDDTVFVRYPLNIKIKGDNIKSVALQLNDNSGLLYRATSYQLVDDKNNSKLRNDENNSSSTNTHWGRKSFDELSEKDKEVFIEYLGLPTDEVLDEKLYIKRFSDAIYSKDKDDIYHYRQDDSWKRFMWVYDQRGKEITFDYNQQDSFQYKMMLEQVIQYKTGENPTNTDAIKLHGDIKNGLVAYEITMEIEYNNGIVKEKQISFKELQMDTIDPITGFPQITVIMEIK